jgi:integrase
MARYNKLPYQIYKRERSSFYQLKVNTIINGQRVQFRESTGCSEENQAKQYAQKRFAQVVQEFEFRTDKTKLKEYTLDQALGMYWEEIGQYHSNPNDTYSKINVLTRELPVNIPLSHLIVDDFANLVKFKRKEGKSNATINRYLALLSAVFNLCKKRRINIPDVNIRDFMLKEKAENIKYIPNWETMDKIINAASDHLKPIILFALYTGLRKSDILELKWEDIQGDRIIVQVKDCSHDGGKTHFVDIFPALQELLDNQPRINNYIFTYKGERIKDIKTAWHTALKKANVKYVNFHTLRHTCATWILQRTGNLKLVQQTLGHSDMRVTSKYAHVIKNTNQMESIFRRI